MDLHKNVYNDCIMRLQFASRDLDGVRPSWHQRIRESCTRAYTLFYASLLRPWRRSKNENLQLFRTAISLVEDAMEFQGKSILTCNFTREIRDDPARTVRLWKNSHRFFDRSSVNNSDAITDLSQPRLRTRHPRILRRTREERGISTASSAESACHERRITNNWFYR